MADNSNNILNQLQQYGTQPPAGAFDRAWQCIAEEKEREELKPFLQLQEHTLPAPELNFHLLTDKSNEKAEAVPGRFMLPLPLMKAAAVLLVMATATVLYFTVFNKKENTENKYAATGTKKDVTGDSTINELGVKATDTTLKAAATVAEAKNALNITTTKSTDSKKSFVKKSTKGGTRVSFGDNNTATLYDNDVFFTLVNYRGSVNSWGPLFTDAVADKTITLNKYSYLNMSDKMVAMLQDVYLTKKNGKPSRKAKKIKRKCEKWRKKDDKYFDRDMQKNPVDIIDLSDFIL